MCKREQPTNAARNLKQERNVQTKNASFPFLFQIPKYFLNTDYCVIYISRKKAFLSLDENAVLNRFVCQRWEEKSRLKAVENLTSKKRMKILSRLTSRAMDGTKKWLLKKMSNFPRSYSRSKVPNVLVIVCLTDNKNEKCMPVKQSATPKKVVSN